MIRFAYDLYPRTNPISGARIGRFSKLQAHEYRGEANGTGAGRIILRGTSADGALIDPAGLQYVRVRRINTAIVDGSTLSGFSEAVVGGFFLENGEFEALTERSTSKLTFGGAGTLSFLFRGIAAEQTYIAGSDGPYDDTWHWFFSPAGAIFHRMVRELLEVARPQSPIAGVTLTFTEQLDSDGNAWPGYGTSWLFTARVGEGLASITRRLMEAGLYVWMNPDTFALSAWMANAHGRARTGLAWGANVVRFQAPTDGTIATASIKSDAKRGLGALVKRSDLLVGDKGNYDWIHDAASTIVWEGGYRVEDPTGGSFAAIGAAQLDARTDAGDTVRLRMKVDNDPATGKYLPFEHVQLDDHVTLHSGTGQWDWNESEQKVAAITIKSRSARQSDAWVDLGSRYSSPAERAFQVQPVGGHNHGPNPQLCQPTVEFVETGADWKILGILGSREPAGWNEVGFDDSAWSTPIEATGASGLQTVRHNNDSIPSDRCIARKEYIVAAADLSGADVVFKFAFDNAGAVFVNGVQVASLTGTASSNYTSDHATTIPRSAFVEGVNCVAIRTENDSAGSVGATPPGPHSGAAYIAMPVNGFAATGSSGQAARCDHPHVHNDLLGRDAVNPHPGLTGAAQLGSLTVDGSPVTVSSGADHRAFPGVVPLDADRFLVVFRHGTNHNAGGNIVGRIGTWTGPTTYSLGSEFTIYDHATLDVRCEDGVSIVDGRVVIYARLYDGAVNNSPFLLLCDDGPSDLTSASTWTNVSVPLTFYSTQNSSQGHVTKLQNGKYLAPFAGISGTTFEVGVLISASLTDWSAMTRVVVATSTSNWSEIAVEELPGGTLMALIRSQSGTNTHRSTSTDHGATWSATAVAHDGFGYPMFRRLISGLVLTVYRDAPDGDTAWRFSADDGASWGTETILDTTGTRMVYATLLQRTETKILCLYAVEGTGSPATDADIYSQVFTDSSFDYTHHDELAGVGRDQHHPQNHELAGSDHFAAGLTTGHVLTAISPTAVAFQAPVGGNLNSLTDVTITSPALSDRLRYDGSEWRNSAKRWVPMTTDPTNNGSWALLFTDGGDVYMSEVEG